MTAEKNPGLSVTTDPQSAAWSGCFGLHQRWVLFGDAEAGVVPLVVVAAVEGEGDRRAEEALHLVAEAADGAPAAAARQEAELSHEAAERVAQVEGRALGADGLGGDPRHQEPRVAAVGESQERVGRHGENQVAVSSEEGVGGWAGVRQGRLDENPGHEPQGARLLSLFGLDGESLGGELARAGARVQIPGGKNLV